MDTNEEKKECTIDLKTLFAYFDRELEIQAQHQVEQHLLRCDRCTNRLKEVRQIKKWLHLTTPPPLSPYFAKKITAKLRISKKPRKVSWVLGTVSMVLMLLMGNLTGGLLSHHNNSSQPELISRYYRLNSFNALPESSLGNAYLSILKEGHE